MIDKPILSAGAIELDEIVASFEEAVLRDPTADPADFLPESTHPLYSQALRELLRIDLELAWERGESKRIDSYRARIPNLFRDREALAAVAEEEVRQRRAAGESPDSTEYLRHYGIVVAGNERSATFRVSGSASWNGASLPQIGDVLPPGYVLTRILGQGAFGRVYLAEQTDLASRQVAIKVSSRLIDEAQTLARLQHANIVPVYSIHRVGSYQVLVMPYFGAATLSDLVRMITGAGSIPTTGQEFWTMLSTRDAESPGEAPEPIAISRPSLPAHFSGHSYDEIVVSFGIELADALAHAHDRGILHRDLKPANVLVTDDGHAMLLDFNLASDQRGDSRSIGGTPRYMAPEQLAALANLPATVDARSDVYGLGLLLHKLFTGRLPFENSLTEANASKSSVDALRRERCERPKIQLRSPGLTAIVRKALEPNPDDRYQSAGDLRDDLERHQSSRPLGIAREPWGRERARKWARRHPRLASATSIGAISIALLALATYLGYSAWHRQTELEAIAARDDVRRARNEMQHLVLNDHGPAEPLRMARDVARRALAPYQVDRSEWENGRAVRRLRRDEADHLKAELAELFFYDATASSALADRTEGDERQQLLRDAHVSLDRAAKLLPTESIVRQKRVVAGRLGMADDGENTPIVVPSGGGEYLQAIIDFREKRYSLAATRFAALVESTPSYSSWMGLALSRLALNQFEPAAEAFFAASVLAPKEPWPHFHRGVALLAMEKDARPSFDRFIAEMPGEADGYINRALARFQHGQWNECLDDLDTAEKTGGSMARVRGLRERVYRRTGKAIEAGRERSQLLREKPVDAEGWTILGEAIITSDPKQAIQNFDRAISIRPNYLPALRGKASCLSEQLHRPDDALAITAHIVATGGTNEDRGGHSVLLARLGQRNEAQAQARACIVPQASATSLYQAASALCLIARSPEERREVVSIIRRVLRLHADYARDMMNDADLKNVQQEPEFRALVSAGQLLGTGK